MDSGLDRASPSSRIRRALWPGLWIPVVILLVGSALSLSVAQRIASQTEALAQQHYHLQHRTLVHLVLDHLYRHGNDVSLLKVPLAKAMPKHLSLRIDTLERHTKKPLLKLGSIQAPLTRQALRSELDIDGNRSMVTTMPDAQLLKAPAQNLRWLVLISGMALTLLAFVLSLYLCWRYQRQRTLASSHHKDLKTQNQKIANLNVEKLALRQALNDSENRSRDLINLTGNLIAELDDQGQIEYISALAADMFRQAPSDLDQKPFQQLVVLSDQQRFTECLEAARADQDITQADLTLAGENSEQPVPVTLRLKALTDPVRGLIGFRLSAQIKTRRAD
ncbi:PAS domain-containing protein [Marinobacter sp.]|uniref:PAS domain-containing protein n=1 Tax=Marinobacter sp. TaxID=50741 RepID=UPI002B2700B5|nr:PAS domain-containing protein [Marinobacter sp.]